MPTSFETECEAALCMMNDKLRDAYEKIMDEIRRATEDDVMARHRIGKIVMKVRDHEQKYGEGAVAKLAVGLGGLLTGEELWHARCVAENFSKKEVRSLLKRTTPNGNWISFRDLAAVAELPPDRRKDVIKRIFDDGLTADDIGLAREHETFVVRKLRELRDVLERFEFDGNGVHPLHALARKLDDLIEELDRQLDED